MWKSASLTAKWLAALFLFWSAAVWSWPWSAGFALFFLIWFTDWYQGLLPAFWFDLTFGLPLTLPWFKIWLPATILMVVAQIAVNLLKRRFNFRL